VRAGRPRREGRRAARAHGLVASLLVHLALDDELHDLGRPSADGHEPRVAEELLRLAVFRVTDTARHLQGLRSDLLSRYAGEELRRSALPRRRKATVDAPGGLKCHQPRRVQLDRHVGDLEADALERSDLSPELLALRRVLDGVLEGSPAVAHGAGG